MTRYLIAKILIAVPAVLCALAGPAFADDAAKPEPKTQAKADPKPDAKPAFRVCGDPSNLPFSNEKREGLENKIADVIAKDLGLPLEYTWWPHQRGVVKRVLNTGRCDVMLGIPKGYDPVAWTKPYYRTGYVMAYRKDRGLKLHSLDDAQLKTLKIGVLVNTPPHEALAQHGVPADNIVGYQLMFDSNAHPDDYPGKEIEELIAGQIDVALVWGPIAGYFAKKKGAPIEVVLLEEPAAGSPFAFDISMGVKKNNKELKARLEDSIARKRDEIARILEEFGVPLLPVAEGKTEGKNRDKGKP